MLLTALTATTASILGFLGGTPIAYLLARRRFAGRSILAAVFDLPPVVPHPVAGIALLLVLGRGTSSSRHVRRRPAPGRFARRHRGRHAVRLGAAEADAREAFALGRTRAGESVARTLGDPPWTAFRRVTLPLAGRGLAASAIVMWARAVSEFGAIVILTYNPKVASVLSYDRFTSYWLSEAVPVAAVLVVLAPGPLPAALAGERPATGGSRVIALEHVNAQVGGGRFALLDVTFEVPQGAYRITTGQLEVCATTLLETIAGVVTANSGTIRLGGEDLTRTRRPGATSPFYSIPARLPLSAPLGQAEHRLRRGQPHRGRRDGRAL